MLAVQRELSGRNFLAVLTFKGMFRCVAYCVL